LALGESAEFEAIESVQEPSPLGFYGFDFPAYFLYRLFSVLAFGLFGISDDASYCSSRE